MAPSELMRSRQDTLNPFCTMMNDVAVVQQWLQAASLAIGVATERPLAVEAICHALSDWNLNPPFAACPPLYLSALTGQISPTISLASAMSRWTSTTCRSSRDVVDSPHHDPKGGFRLSFHPRSNSCCHIGMGESLPSPSMSRTMYRSDMIPGFASTTVILV